MAEQWLLIISGNPNGKSFSVTFHSDESWRLKPFIIISSVKTYKTLNNTAIAITKWANINNSFGNFSDSMIHCYEFHISIPVDTNYESGTQFMIWRPNQS